MALVARDDRSQFLLGPLGRINARGPRRRLVNALRQIRQELLRLLYRLLLRVGRIVDDPALLGVDMGAPEFLLVDVPSQGDPGHGWAGCENLAGSAYHHREMAGGGLHGAGARMMRDRPRRPSHSR